MSIEEERAEPPATLRAQGMLHAIPALAARHRQLILFVIVGFGNTVVGYALFAGMFMLTQSHRLSLVVATVLGVLFNFFTTGRIVFGNRRKRALFAFVGGYVVTLGINFVLLDWLVGAGVHALVAQAVTLPFVVVAGYLINSRIVFRRKSA